MKKESLANRNKRSTATCATVFLFPVFLFLVVFIFYPIINDFYISGFSWNGISSDMTFIGLKNWQNLIKDTTFWVSFGHNLIIMVFSIILQIPIGLLLATFLEFISKKKKISRVFKTLWFLPYLMSSVAIGFLFTYALATNGGIFSTVSGWFGGGNINLLGNPKTALGTIIVIIAWQFIPFYMVYAMAGYGGISEDVYEASIIDGATKGQYFRYVAIPLLRPTLIAAATLSLVGSLKYFDLIYVMTNGGPGTSTELMATYMYRLSFSEFNMGYGSAVAGGMFILITIIAVLSNTLLNRGGDN
ncbi:MAG: sugar ABC transporter permease [Clostridiales bacterium]|nr:sugar ABC transporter permease [Clostridiales bacterium]